MAYTLNVTIQFASLATKTALMNTLLAINPFSGAATQLYGDSYLSVMVGFQLASGAIFAGLNTGDDFDGVTFLVNAGAGAASPLPLPSISGNQYLRFLWTSFDTANDFYLPRANFADETRDAWCRVVVPPGTPDGSAITGTVTVNTAQNGNSFSLTYGGVLVAAPGYLPGVLDYAEVETRLLSALTTRGITPALVAKIDGAPTAQDNAAAILASPGNKLATDEQGAVTTTTSGGGGGGGGEGVTVVYPSAPVPVPLKVKQLSLNAVNAGQSFGFVVRMKEGDTAPSRRVQLVDGGSGSCERPISIAGATVRYLLVSLNEQGAPGATFRDRPAAILSAEAGLLEYAFQGSDTDTVGRYSERWRVTFADGKIITFSGATVAIEK